jgi:hypothetical protein
LWWPQWQPPSQSGFRASPYWRKDKPPAPYFCRTGKLKLPTGFRNWVFIGGPLTPNGLNGGQANFPEFHNVYVEARNLEAYKKTGSSRKARSL